MNKLELYVCSNLCPEINHLLKNMDYPAVTVIEYPCACLINENHNIISTLLQNNEHNSADKVIICSKTCGIFKFLPAIDVSYQVKTLEYCHEYLVTPTTFENLVQDGNYLVTTGWLQAWAKNLKQAGFDEITAPRFFKDFCTKLIFLNTAISPNSINELKACANYLKLPYEDLPCTLQYLTLFLENIILKWRFSSFEEKANNLSYLHRENAKYAAMVDIIQKFSNTKTKTAIITEVKNILTLILGANSCEYTEDLENLPPEFKLGQPLLVDSSQHYLILEDNNGFFIKVLYFDQPLALIKVSDFLFPEYLLKYLDFASSIIHVCSVALQNATHIEALEQHKHILNYISIHDHLTTLYNRAYFNEVLEDIKDSKHWALFVCDIDGLKVVNDTYGHTEGDNLIIKITELLKSCFRETDIIARLGGDEFGIIVKKCNQALAEKLQKRFYQLLENYTHDKAWTVHASLGYVCAEKTASVAEIFKAADEAMYQQKQLYKNSL